MILVNYSISNLMIKRRFLCGTEEHFLPRVNAREVKIERGKDAKLCIIFTSTYFHPVPLLFLLSLFFSYFPLSLSLFFCLFSFTLPLAIH